MSGRLAGKTALITAAGQGIGRGTAEAFARENRIPRFDETGGGDVVWVLIAAASSRDALKHMIAAARRRYPGKRVMGVRYKPGGQKILFDSLNRQPGG